jgi:15-cis-phytoene synthase
MATSAPQSWELPLLSLAYAGGRPVVSTSPRPAADPAVIERAYAHCEALTAQHSRTFHAATRLLPGEKRRAMRALYAFCRVSDNIVDCARDADVGGTVAAWRHRASMAMPPADDLVATAWADTRSRFRIPLCYAEQLVDGVARDLRQTRYATFADLTSYAYGVASTVGLMSMYIVGFAGAAAIPYAVKLGVALQLTNILRDVAEDWRTGRVYLPSDELAAYGLADGDLACGRVDERWRSFMRFQIERNRRLYAEAWPGIALLHRDGRLAVAAAGDLYRAILRDIEAHDYDVFQRRAHIGGWARLSRLPGIWWHLPRTRDGHALL